MEQEQHKPNFWDDVCLACAIGLIGAAALLYWATEPTTEIHAGTVEATQ